MSFLRYGALIASPASSLLIYFSVLWHLPGVDRSVFYSITLFLGIAAIGDGFRSALVMSHPRPRVFWSASLWLPAIFGSALLVVWIFWVSSGFTVSITFLVMVLLLAQIFSGARCLFRVNYTILGEFGFLTVSLIPRLFFSIFAIFYTQQLGLFGFLVGFTLSRVLEAAIVFNFSEANISDVLSFLRRDEYIQVVLSMFERSLVGFRDIFFSYIFLGQENAVQDILYFARRSADIFGDSIGRVLESLVARENYSASGFLGSAGLTCAAICIYFAFPYIPAISFASGSSILLLFLSLAFFNFCGIILVYRAARSASWFGVGIWSFLVSIVMYFFFINLEEVLSVDDAISVTYFVGAIILLFGSALYMRTATSIKIQPERER
ncbi:hypothetical protein [Sulfitobacter sp. W074]|uniref:hypothetical protein n=1 Tax=Sulfitobacter sp. W074 TaxID=2867026 RepID=UPI0021A53065|nr:hypothetical protein [Sulfitobacter sp. W074]UWR39641.1 hypothetical protein K3762_19325 [Sulfitobacter sp. W074]